MITISVGILSTAVDFFETIVDIILVISVGKIIFGAFGGKFCLIFWILVWCSGYQCGNLYLYQFTEYCYFAFCLITVEKPKMTSILRNCN